VLVVNVIYSCLSSGISSIRSLDVKLVSSVVCDAEKLFVCVSVSQLTD